jgi:hypothetical protein
MGKLVHGSLSFWFGFDNLIIQLERLLFVRTPVRRSGGISSAGERLDGENPDRLRERRVFIPKENSSPVGLTTPLHGGFGVEK